MLRLLLFLRETSPSHFISQEGSWTDSQGPGDFVLSGNLLQGNSTAKLARGVPWYILLPALALRGNKRDAEYRVGIEEAISHTES